MSKEASARIKINDLLKESGWRFFDEKGKPANVVLENQTKITQKMIDDYGNDFEQVSRGFIDFLLLDEHSHPIIVLEAKSEKYSPLVGKEQARTYARSHNCRFILPVQPGNKVTTQKPTKPGEVDFTVLQDYSYKSARVVVVNGITTPVKHWWEIKKHVYNYLLEKNPALASSDSLALFAKKNDIMDIRLINGMYSRGRMSATDIVKQSRAAMKIAGYEPLKDLQVGYVESERKRKGL